MESRALVARVRVSQRTDQIGSAAVEQSKTSWRGNASHSEAYSELPESRLGFLEIVEGVIKEE